MPQATVEETAPVLLSEPKLSRTESLAGFQGPQFRHFNERPVSRLFEEQVARAAGKTAVTCENLTLTYGELNARANQLAHHLRVLGVGPESLVGVCIDRSLEMAVGILGILKAGAAYLPLDPEYPQDRLSFMIRDARPSVVLTKAKLAGQLFATDSYVVSLDDDWSEIAQREDVNPSETSKPTDLAYVIYTSGSTGTPKGVMIEHGNLANYLLALDHELEISAEDVYLHTASIAFSSSRRQLLLPLSQGASVVIATDEQRKDPLALFAMIKTREVTIMDAVPSFWRSCTSTLALLNQETRKTLLDNRLRLMLSASEPLLSDIPRTWISEFQHQARHVHMFGQTETAGIVCLYRVPEILDDELRGMPIGRPIANSEIYILDALLQPCAAGVAGELYIGGAGVGRGYLNRRELTAEKFIQHPFNAAPADRLYRTGDWARLRADGNIEFAGRRDQQVKLRGFRVELGEVETVLAKHPAISECVLTTAADERAGTRLLAYFVANGDTPNAGELRSFLSQRLPEHAIPSSFIQLAALPLSANGKINRLALPQPEAGNLNFSTAYLAPRNSGEERLAMIWSQVLRLERVGVNDNFFELGGHSLLAAQVITRVRAEFKIDVALRLLFDAPTVALLAVAITGDGASAGLPGSETIERGQENGSALLSFTQQQFWLLDKGESGSAYNISIGLMITGPLDVRILRHALEKIVERHEILRTNVVMTENGLTQIVAQNFELPFSVSNLQQVPLAEREAERQKAAAAEAEQPFDLGTGPLLRVQVLSFAGDQHTLLVTLHHIICDGWSTEILLREIATLYADFRVGRPASLPPLTIQYADFAAWQRRRLQGERFDRQLQYWRQELAGAPPFLELPTDYPRPQHRILQGAQESIVLSREVSNAIRRLGQREGATLFMTLLAAFQSLLFHYSGQQDIVVGTPVAGRSLLETENLIGAFVNTLAHRTDFSDNPSIRDLLARVRETSLRALSNQELPFEKLVEELNPERAMNRTPLFQVMFVLQNSSNRTSASEELTLTRLDFPATKAKFDLTLAAAEKPEGIQLTFEYSSELFAPETISRLLAQLNTLLEAIVADPAQPVSELSLLTESERHQLLLDWSNAGARPAVDTCIHTLFEAQVEKTPEAVAVEFRGQQVTYRELNRRTNQLANFLIKRGVTVDTFVGLCVSRSFDMLVGMLGVLKAGGAYVPLDPGYPAERLEFMIEDAGLSLVLTQDCLTNEIPSGRAELFCLDKDWTKIYQESDANPQLDLTSANLAYVIYTSGSTGKPKGVMIEHRSLVSFTAGATDIYGIGRDDRVLQFASLCFDISVEEIFPALTNGATLVLRTDEMISSARDFLHYCEEQRITVLDLPTAYWHELTDALSNSDLQLPDTVRLVIIGGEKASLDRVVAWHKITSGTVRLLNTYGPTEATVVATTYDLSTQEQIGRVTTAPIGKPIAHATVYLLNESLRLVPSGSPGELYIGGPQVARGYLNRPDLTAKHFIRDPFSANPEARLYKTGDLVRYRADGNLEFLGRVDNQVKIRGFRVELEEIETALRMLPGVNDCVVIMQEDVDGDKRLIAYLVQGEQIQCNHADLRKKLQTQLPPYMVPVVFETIPTWPRLPNGKINRRALPKVRARSSALDDSYVAPRTPIEQLLAAEWCEVLKLDRVGIHENFFELGGHSLLAAKVVSRVQNSLAVEMGMVDLFQAPTIAGLAALLFPRGLVSEPDDELVALMEEMANLTDEEAQLRFENEMHIAELAQA